VVAEEVGRRRVVGRLVLGGGGRFHHPSAFDYCDVGKRKGCPPCAHIRFDMPFTASESKPLVWLDIAEDALVILDIFSKKSGKTPMKVREACRDRLARYRKLTEED
jgi:hypothetical protein